MPQHLLQPSIPVQMAEIFQTFPTQRIEHHKAFHHRSFVVASLPLLDMHLSLDAGRQP